MTADPYNLRVIAEFRARGGIVAGMGGRSCSCTTLARGQEPNMRRHSSTGRLTVRPSSSSPPTAELPGTLTGIAT